MHSFRGRWQQRELKQGGRRGGTGYFRPDPKKMSVFLEGLRSFQAIEKTFAMRKIQYEQQRFIILYVSRLILLLLFYDFFLFKDIIAEL